MLAEYRTILRYGGSLEDTGWVIHYMLRAEIERVPAVIRRWMGNHRIMGRIRANSWGRAPARPGLGERPVTGQHDSWQVSTVNVLPVASSQAGTTRICVS